MQRVREFGFAILLAGALLNFLPFAAIDRLMYIYHYLFGLTFVIAFAALSTGVLAGWMEHDEKLLRSAALSAHCDVDLHSVAAHGDHGIDAHRSTHRDQTGEN